MKDIGDLIIGLVIISLGVAVIFNYTAISNQMIGVACLIVGSMLVGIYQESN